MYTVASAGLVLFIVTGLSVVGILPWLELSARAGDTDIAGAGKIVQIGVTVLVIFVSAFIPSNIRVLRLEAAHREFRVGMDDVLQAYKLAHAHDRAGAFKIQSEFDSVRERFEYLRDHPNLEELDSELLTIAAQMSHQSRDLARIYSDEKMGRVRDALEQRRTDADVLHDRIQSAHTTIRDVRRALDEVEIEESAVAAQLQRLHDEMTELIALGTQAGLKSANEAQVPRLRSVDSRALAAD